MNKVCVYAIFKNEDKNIYEWLSCVKDADLIVMLNNSEDHSGTEIIQKFIEDNNCNNIHEVFCEESLYDVGFSYLRNKALYTAKDIIKDNMTSDDEWIFVSLDLDEFLEPNGIQKIKNLWKAEYDMMYIRGDMYNPDGSVNCSGDIYHKIHSSNPNIKWIRFVHELIEKSGTPLDECNIYHPNNDIVHYTHEPDQTKEHEYYTLLKQAHKKEPMDVKNNMYLAWGAYEHQEYENYFKYINDALHYILTNKNDEYYQNPEYIIMCHLNIANYYNIKEDYENACKHYEIIHKDYINTNKFDKFRRVYFEAAQTYSIIYNIDHNVIHLFRAMQLFEETLSIKTHPFCFVDNNALYETDNYLYFSLSSIYFELSNSKFLSLNERREYLEKSIEYLINILEGESDVLKVEAESVKDDIVNRLKEFSKKYGVTRNENKICVYAICKNEEQFVDKWCESMKEADYVVVLDTGSTDNTVQKLREHGVIVDVKTYDPWRFDTPRNDAMDLIPEDANILISTDLDEILEPGWADILREKWIDGVHERATYKYSWSHLPNGESGRIFHYNKIHSRKWIWRYPVHELLWNVKTKSELYPVHESLYLFNEIHLHHYPDQTKSRGSYLPLLELRAEENKDDYYGLIYLSHEYYYRCFYDKSIETLNKVLTYHDNECNDIERASCYLFMGDDYVCLKDNDKAKDSYMKAIDVSPLYREAYMNLAKVYLDEQDYDNAIYWVKEGITKSVRQYTWLERDLSWTYEPYDLLTLACYYSGRRAESIAYAAKALSYEPSNPRLKENLELCIEGTNDIDLIRL